MSSFDPEYVRKQFKDKLGGPPMGSNNIILGGQRN